MKPLSLLVVAIAVLLGVGAVLSTTIWLRGSGPQAAEQSPAVYVCRKSGEVFLGRGQSAPQVHPETQRPTLFPGLYCRQCQSWKPAPPMERLYGRAELLNCPVCKSRRSFDGVVPEGVRKL